MSKTIDIEELANEEARKRNLERQPAPEAETIEELDEAEPTTEGE